MADWGWGFTSPQPLPNPVLSRAKGNFQLTKQKKGDRSLPEINYLCFVMKYKQLTSQQRSQIFALLQRKTPRKEIALIVGCSQATLSCEIRRNSTAKGAIYLSNCKFLPSKSLELRKK